MKDYIELCDGVSLAYLISYYCPNTTPWTEVRSNYMPTVDDSLYNIILVSSFSQKYLPYSVFHMTPEDVVYMRGYVLSYHTNIASNLKFHILQIVLLHYIDRWNRILLFFWLIYSIYLRFILLNALHILEWINKWQVSTRFQTYIYISIGLNTVHAVTRSLTSTFHSVKLIKSKLKACISRSV